jgi:hypothetical protein
VALPEDHFLQSLGIVLIIHRRLIRPDKGRHMDTHNRITTRSTRLRIAGHHRLISQSRRLPLYVKDSTVVQLTSANTHIQPPGPPPGRTNLYSPVRMTVILYSVSNTPAATRSTTSCAYCGKYCCQSFVHMKLNCRLALELERLLSNHE